MSWECVAPAVKGVDGCAPGIGHWSSRFADRGLVLSHVSVLDSSALVGRQSCAEGGGPVVLLLLLS